MPFPQVLFGDICSYLASLTKKFGTKLNLMNSKSRLYFCEISLQIFVKQILVCLRSRKYIVKRPVELRLAFRKYDLNFSAKEAKQNRMCLAYNNMCLERL